MRLAPGSVLHFSTACPLPLFTGAKATVDSVRTYVFGGDTTVSYPLSIDGRNGYQLTVAEDELGYYLGISRELSEAEQDHFFGRDALGFFKEESSARSIRCKADPAIDGAWTALRYSKTVDWVEGNVIEGRLSTTDTARHARAFRYNLLADEVGIKALEIEHYGTTENKVMLTVYRPAEDIVQISEPIPNIPLPKAAVGLGQEPKARPQPTKTAATEPELFAPAATAKARPDFRKLEESAEIHIGKPTTNEKPVPNAADIPPLPSFLLSRENSYLSLDEILTPETERMRCDLTSAKILIDTALKRRVHVSEIMRDLLGLESRMADEAVFELPLSDKDYYMLAQRYRLRPDRKVEIRACLQEELRLKLLSIAKN